jgi:hypothetical protein
MRPAICVAGVAAWSCRPRAGVANAADGPPSSPALLLTTLAAVPAVTAEGGDGDHQDTVSICHFDTNRDGDGQAISNAGCVSAPRPEPEKKVPIGHATSSDNPADVSVT